MTDTLPLAAGPIPATRRLALLAGLLSFALGGASLAGAQGDYIERLALVPRVGQGLGTVSPYANVAPVLAPNEVGHELVTLPAPERNEVNLVWTFWGHRAPSPEQWPAGPGARTVFTVTSPSDITLHTRVAVLAGSWSSLRTGPILQLKAGQPFLAELPLPLEAVSAPVERLRLNFVASVPVPELKFFGWSVGEAPAPSASAPAADTVYTPLRSLIPLTGDGTVSEYAGAKPRFEKDAQGFDFLRVPAAGAKELSLVWTYWSHRRLPASEWPSGDRARASLTLRSAADVTLHTRLFVRSSDWSAPVSGPTITLTAGQAQAIQLPLPAFIPPGAIENLRISLVSPQPVPELTVLYWSVGEER